MPELPDLQVISGNLARRFVGKRLSSVTVQKTKKLTTSSGEFASAFAGATLASICRDGKELKLNFDNGNMLALHLMREGQLTAEDDGSSKHRIIELRFEGGAYLAMLDFMKQATAVINPPQNSVPDALSDSFTLEYLSSILAKKKTVTLKAFLVDQSNMRGIGNAYADEILWAARISPFSKCGNVPQESVTVLYEKIGEVLKGAEAKIRERSPDLISGEIRDFLNVHRKDVSQTPTGVEILNEKVGGKSTYYTSEQALYE